jgi:hypothetical protein
VLVPTAPLRGGWLWTQTMYGPCGVPSEVESSSTTKAEKWQATLEAAPICDVGVRVVPHVGFVRAHRLDVQFDVQTVSELDSLSTDDLTAILSVGEWTAARIQESTDKLVTAREQDRHQRSPSSNADKPDNWVANLAIMFGDLGKKNSPITTWSQEELAQHINMQLAVNDITVDSDTTFHMQEAWNADFFGVNGAEVVQYWICQVTAGAWWHNEEGFTGQTIEHSLPFDFYKLFCHLDEVDDYQDIGHEDARFPDATSAHEARQEHIRRRKESGLDYRASDAPVEFGIEGPGDGHLGMAFRERDRSMARACDAVLFPLVNTSERHSWDKQMVNRFKKFDIDVYVGDRMTPGLEEIKPFNGFPEFNDKNTIDPMDTVANLVWPATCSECGSTVYLDGPLACQQCMTCKREHDRTFTVSASNSQVHDEQQLTPDLLQEMDRKERQRFRPQLDFQDAKELDGVRLGVHTIDQEEYASTPEQVDTGSGRPGGPNDLI